MEKQTRYIRISVNRKRKDDITRTINIDREKGIKALYATNRRVVLEYIFLRSKWTLREAKRWVEQHKNNQESMKKIKGYVEKVDDKDRTLIGVASDETYDRHGDVLKQEGWDLDNFQKNPVLQWAHKPDVPAIGKIEDIKIQKGKLVFYAKFSKSTKLAKEVYELYKEGILKAFSVGYKEKEKDSKGETTLMELLEISCVNVGANPNALVLAKQKGLNTDLVSKPKKDSVAKIQEKIKDIDSKIENIDSNVKDLADGFKHLEPKKKQGRDERIKAQISEVLRTAQGVDKVNESQIKKLKDMLNEQR